MLNRHDWVWLRADLTGYAPEIIEWAQASRPFVVTRQNAQNTESQINLAFVRPNLDKALARVGFLALREDGIQVRKGPVFSGLPGLTPRLYGSHAWQAFTGLTYVRPSSDIDLLFDVASTQMLSQIEQAVRPLWDQLDGELIFGGTHAVAFKEFFSDTETVLCKTLHEAYLCTRSSLYAKIGRVCSAGIVPGIDALS